jgi:transposase
MRPKIALLQQALQGRLEPQHGFLLKETLAHLDFLQQRVAQLEQEVAQRLSPFEKSITLLMTIPGISRRSATILRIANSEQIGQRLRAQHISLHGWGFVLEASLRAGKRRSGKPTKGNPYLRSVLTQVAWVLTRMSDHSLSAPLRHLKPRLGAKKAVVAVAHSVLGVIDHVLAKAEPYQDLGADYFHGQDKEQQARRMVRQ